MVFKKKRGLSPIVATVLLITLAVILALIIFLWARGFISEQIEKRGTPIDRVCEQIEIQASYSPGDRRLTVSNRGSFQIHAIEVREESPSSSNVRVYETNIPPLDSRTFNIDLIDNPERIIIYPQVLGTIVGKEDHKAKTCLNAGKTINL